MSSSRYKHEMPLDLHTPLSDHEKEVVARIGGPVPKHELKQWPPYDELYLKQKASRDYWS